MACLLCDRWDDLTDEDVVPKWLLRLFDVQGPSTITVREEAGHPREVGSLRQFQVTLDKGLCRRCNTELLGRLEQVVKPILGPMAARNEPTILDLASQRLLAVWAIKTVYLMELAIRQRYPATRTVEGYQPSRSEIGWLLAELERGPAQLVEPPPHSMVWLACWDCRSPSSANQGSMVNYAPSLAPLPAPNGGEVAGQFATLSVGFAAFQVFTVDYVEAEVRKAKVWNPGPPDSIAEAIRLIWPHRWPVLVDA